MLEIEWMWWQAWGTADMVRARMIKPVEIHSKAEIEAEVKRLRPQLAKLIEQRDVRVWCVEEDLKTLAYNRLTERKL